MKYCCYIVFVISLLSSCQPRLVEPLAVKAERERFVLEKTRFIDSVFRLLPEANNEKKYQGAFWASELMLKKSDKAAANINQALVRFDTFSDNFKRALLQHIYTLYPGRFVSKVDSLILLERDEKLFAMMANYLIRQNDAAVGKYLKIMQDQFPSWQDKAILCAFTVEHSVQPSLTNKQIDELIAFRKEMKEPGIFVFIHKNRDIPGVAIIFDKKGKLLRENGDTLKIRLLSRSITNMAEYLTNGNTPRGVLSMQGFSSSDNVFIGKSPTIITALPFEVSPSVFSFGKYNNKDWSPDLYQHFFPESWKDYNLKNMAYLAGKAGRGEIIIHGTTIDTEFYKQQPYYPFTPSLGCLCALERWNETDGSLIESEQVRFVNALKTNGIEKALIYLIER